MATRLVLNEFDINLASLTTWLVIVIIVVVSSGGADTRTLDAAAGHSRLVQSDAIGRCRWVLQVEAAAVSSPIVPPSSALETSMVLPVD